MARASLTLKSRGSEPKVLAVNLSASDRQELYRHRGPFLYRFSSDRVVERKLCQEYGPKTTFCVKPDSFKSSEDGLSYSVVADIVRPIQRNPAVLSPFEVVAENVTISFTLPPPDAE